MRRLRFGLRASRISALADDGFVGGVQPGGDGHAAGALRPCSAGTGLRARPLNPRAQRKTDAMIMRGIRDAEKYQDKE